MIESFTQAAAAAKFASESIVSLTKDPKYLPLGIYRKTYEQNADTFAGEPLNDEESLLVSFQSTLDRRNIHPPHSYRTYWDSSQEYNGLEVFGSVIQCFDQHQGKLPKTVLPPSVDVKRYIEGVKGFGKRITIPQQLELLLDITNNNLIGAANIGWIGSRIMARAADKRAYPEIEMDSSTLVDWNTRITQFATYDGKKTSDGPGDTYYFWTHLFAALIYSNPTIQAKVMKSTFKNGTEVMMFVRKYIAKKPNITSHHPASTLGKEIGIALSTF